MLELLNAINQIIYILLEAAWWVIIIQAILSWLMVFNVINMSNDMVRNIYYALDRMTQPLYRPIRRFMPDLGALDITPMVVLLIIMILQSVVRPNLFAFLARTLI